MKPDLISENKSFLKHSGRWTILVTVITSVVLSGAALYYAFQFQRSGSTLSNTVTITPQIKAVSALGHIRPEGEVIYLSAPSAVNQLGVSRVAQLLVKEGENVKNGQVIAILDNRENLRMVLNLAVEEVKVAQANLAKVKAGAKTGELEAQKATITSLEAEMQGQMAAQDQTIARLEAEFNNSKIEYQRYHGLFEDGAVTASQLDSKELMMETNQKQLNEAKVNRSRIAATFQQQIKAGRSTLNKIAEVSPTDVQVAQAEVNRALANVAKAKADLELAYIRSPINGQILKIHTRPGETVGNKGIVALGQTYRMNVVAEVYELDVSKLRVGQKATITSNAFPGELQGTVNQIGLQVNPQDVLSTDPTTDVDGRIVEVKISLSEADSQRVSSLTNLQVNVVIDT
ncbi:MAG TPA: HlyD family secretion protein [Cyanobacteria bacterium UBA8803]|nr:HlyD family secretion protein [Cyanobacteria bacterium UBA9273]HBL59561.1 HlyD family secretion protein [Cyanobacteria bacterium UBA8803]